MTSLRPTHLAGDLVAGPPLCLLAVLLHGGACHETRYLDGPEPIELDDAYVNEQFDAGAEHPVIGVFRQAEYWLDFRGPRVGELEQLQPEGAEPADQRPFIPSDALRLSISWRLENTSDRALRAFVLLDGATEFYDWNPVPLYGIGGGEEADELPLPSLLGLTPILLEPGQVVTGEFRDDDTSEATYDLDVLTRFCGSPLSLLYNRREVEDPRSGNVPEGATRAGMVMLRLTLGSDGPATLAYSVRALDARDLLFDPRRDDETFAPIPSPFVPAGLPRVAAGAVDPSTRTAYCGTTMMP